MEKMDEIRRQKAKEEQEGPEIVVKTSKRTLRSSNVSRDAVFERLYTSRTDFHENLVRAM